MDDSKITGSLLCLKAGCIRTFDAVSEHPIGYSHIGAGKFDADLDAPEVDRPVDMSVTQQFASDCAAKGVYEP